MTSRSSQQELLQKVLRALGSKGLLAHHGIRPEVEREDDFIQIKVPATASLAAAYIEDHLNEQLGLEAPFSVGYGPRSVYITLEEEEGRRNPQSYRNAGRRVQGHLGKPSTRRAGRKAPMRAYQKPQGYLLSMSASDLVALGTSAARAELSRRERDPSTGKKLAWTKKSPRRKTR